MSGSVCVVTGGAGFIGCAVSAALAESFDRVVAIDALTEQVHPMQTRPDRLDPSVQLQVGDVRSPGMWDGMLKGAKPKVVVHLAAETGTGQSLESASLHAGTNVVGTAEMLDALVRNDALPQRIVLVSSRAVYGEGAWVGADGRVIYPPQRTRGQLAKGQWDYPGLSPVPMKAGQTRPAPVSVYGVTKLTQEQLLRSWCSAFGVELSILRLQNVYGPGQSLYNSYTGIVTLFCRLAYGKKEIPLYEDGLVRRDYVAIDDVAAALMSTILADEPTGAPVDIGSGKYTTLRELAEVIRGVFSGPPPRVTGQFRLGDVRHAWADVTEAASILDWSAKISLTSGIAETCEWIASQIGADQARPS